MALYKTCHDYFSVQFYIYHGHVIYLEKCKINAHPYALMKDILNESATCTQWSNTAKNWNTLCLSWSELIVI